MRAILLPLLLAAMLLSGAAEALAQAPQNRSSRYSPSRPTISPWLYLPRGGTGGVPSYYAWVRPQFDLQRREQLIDGEIQSMQGQILREPTRGAGAPSSAASYFNYGHFYPQGGAGGGQR